MSLSRMALRLATMEALRPSASVLMPAWAPDTVYALGAQVRNTDPTYGDLIYQVATSGTSASSGAGPSGIQAVPAWDIGIAYTSGMLAFAAGLVWSAVIDNTGVAPSSDPTRWIPARVPLIVDGTVNWKFVRPLWPTLAQDRLFDSRLAPLDDLDPDDRKAVGVVYTDEDHSVETGQKSGGPPFKREVAVIIDLSMVAMLPTGDQAAPYAAGIPYIDSELEASIDAIEAQARFALFSGPTGKLFRDLTGLMITEIHSMPKRTSEESAPLSSRMLTIKAIVPDDHYDAAPAAQPSGNDRLPEPLKSVVAALAAGSYGAKLAAGLAVNVPVMPTPTPLKTVTLDIQPGSPPGPLDATKPQIDVSIALPQA
jgi:hypothetical protein